MEKDRSHRFIHTREVDESGVWYGLDNAGVIMPPVTDDTGTGLFRLEFTLDHEIDRPVLDRALVETANRFPYFNVALKRGFFWYYLAQQVTSPQACSDDENPCQDYNINTRGLRMFRVRSSGNRVAGEFSHALTDGTGGMAFMKTLLVRYFVLRGIEPGAELAQGEFKDIFKVDSPPDREEYEDAYQRHFTGKLPSPEPNPRAWHMRGPRLPRGSYRIIVGTMKVEEVLAEAKRRNVTITELLGAAYLEALQTLWLEAREHPRHRRTTRREHFISLEIPVNLRNFFATKSLRNFSLFILLRENMNLGIRSFDELVKRAHYQMRLENDPRSIARQISRNAGGVRNVVVRMIPLVIKDIFARILFAKLGETMLSGFISNLGTLKLPPGIAPHITGLAFSPAPSKTTLTNASVISWNDELILTFGSLARSRELERLFFRRMRQLGFFVQVRCRDDEE